MGSRIHATFKWPLVYGSKRVLTLRRPMHETIRMLTNRKNKNKAYTSNTTVSSD